jgi:uncharacterized hydrophobic protein (TIGR00271 family)
LGATTETIGQQRAAVRASVAENSSFDQAYVVMNVLATIVACYGLLADSPAVVIGAMIIAMLLGPISGLGLALVDGDSELLRKALRSIIGGVLVVLITAFVVGLFNREIPATHEMLTRTAPNLFDLMVALGGGAAGAYACISPRLSIAFVGVAIATALVPPLATCSLFVARGEAELAGEAFLLALTNIVAIQFAASAVFYLSGFRAVATGDKLSRGVLLKHAVSVAVLILLTVVLTLNLHKLVSTEQYQSAVRAALKADLAQYPGAYLAEVRYSNTDQQTIVRALVRAPAPFSAEQVGKMQSHLPPMPGRMPVELRVRYVPTTVMSAKGPLFSANDTASGGGKE